MWRKAPPDHHSLPRSRPTPRPPASTSRSPSPIRAARGERGIWQQRYWEHTVRDESDFARHVDYIHINPVKHGLVTRVRDWPHSSFHRMVKLGAYPEDWAGDLSDLGDVFGERLQERAAR
jgi:putative transposase